jgi:hypothetical protein
MATTSTATIYAAPTTATTAVCTSRGRTSSKVFLRAVLFFALLELRGGAAASDAVSSNMLRIVRGSSNTHMFIRSRRGRALTNPTSHDDNIHSSSSKSSKVASITDISTAGGIKAPDLEALFPSNNGSHVNTSDADCNCSDSDVKSRQPDVTIAPAPAQLLYNQTFSNWSILLSQIPVSPSRFLNERPKGLRLAFVGDSITRYQAVSLMYFMKTGEWFRDEVRPSLVAKTDADYGSWDEYLTSTSLRLGQETGNHWCDCYRNDTDDAANPHKIFENRYFRDLANDNYVYLITKLGWSPARGRWCVRLVVDW